jgi:hypothetical protein
MPNYQLLECFINIGGHRDAATFKGGSTPVTYPELLILKTLHGAEHVYDVAQTGETDDIDPTSEFNRLSEKYGGVVRALFPVLGDNVSLPVGDYSFPTCEEVLAASKASDEAMKATRAKRRKAVPDADVPVAAAPVADAPVAPVADAPDAPAAPAKSSVPTLAAMQKN